MGLRIIYGGDTAVMYCSTSDVAFGPVMYDDNEAGHTAEDRMESFCRFLKVDARRFDTPELMQKYGEWLVQESEQWKAEADAEEARELAYEAESDASLARLGVK